MKLLVFVCCCSGPITVTAVLVFDPSALLQEILIPADAAVNSVIYRLIVIDSAFDFPLTYDLKDTSTVAVEPLNCTKFNSVCQANLILKKKLEAGRFYDFKIEATNQRGQIAVMNCSFQATNATTPIEKIFPGAPTLLTVSENARRNTELGSIIAKGNPNRMKAVYLELYGTVQFGIHQKLISQKDAEGTIILLSPLDYETKTVHHLTILANDPWTNINEDTRNIAGWPLLVSVLDEQDTPPIFTIAPPTTTLSYNLKPGDTILRVHAEDGDRGQPRPIRYSLDPRDPSSVYFHILEKTGELTLARPISQVVSFPTQGQPILLKVTAEEVRSNPQEAPSQSTTVQLALIPPGITLGQPTFGALEYHALLDENSPVGTVLDLPQAEITTEPGDVVTLELVKNNGTFDISPSVVEGFARFKITVHDNRLLDYEARHYVECYIVAKELGKGNYTARAKLTVVLNDVNDNPPQFVNTEFKGKVQEHDNVGTEVVVVEATDVDRGSGSKIKYIELSGPGSELFNLEPDTGLITVANSEKLDAETYPKITLKVKAADENGEGLTATSTVIITVSDVNDNIPQFEKDIYEFILNPDRRTFTTQAFIKAFDKDISPPNNVVRYQLITPIDNLFLNENTGELSIKNSWESDELVTVQAKAYDQGIPRLSSDCELRIYPPEKSRKMIFIVPGKYPDKGNTERTLSELTGGKVMVDEIRPYTGNEPGATFITRDQTGDKSVIVATVHYTKDSVVDVNRIQQLLDDQNQRQQDVQGNQQSREHTIIKEREETKIKQSSSGDLLWLLILFIVLAIIAAIILILCCICKPCPLYIPPKRRKIRSADMVEKLVVKGSGHGKESKSVQVAEWFGRKEAWSADKEPVVVMIDAEAESLRRHEVERGSDRGGAKQSHVRHQQMQQSHSMHHLNQQDTGRDHLYIREGNADILRLVTRAGGEPRRHSATFTDQQHQHHYMADSGKDILMRRFIDQQQAEATRQQVLLPNAVQKLQSEQEFLEASLRQQNAMLRQLILERERDLRLETQSLPAGTQTDKDRGTQTEPQYLRPPRRKVQSDLELSDGSDEEIAIIKARAKRRHRVMKPRKIKTPIQEESELEIIEKYEKPFKQKSVDKGVGVESIPKIKQTRTSELRQKRANSEARSSRSKSSRSGLRKDVLKEISASLNHNHSEEDSDSYFEKDKTSPEYMYSEDSLEDVSPRSEKTTDSGRPRYNRSESSDQKSRHRRSESLEQDKRRLSQTLDQRRRRDSELLEQERRRESESLDQVDQDKRQRSELLDRQIRRGSESLDRKGRRGSQSLDQQRRRDSELLEQERRRELESLNQVDQDGRQRSELLDRQIHHGSESLDQKRRRGSQSPVSSTRRKPSQSSNERYRSESDLRSETVQMKSADPKKVIAKSQSQMDLSSGREQTIKKDKKPTAKRTSRYMEWYKKDKDSKDGSLLQDKKDRRKSDSGVEAEKTTKSAVESRLFKETVSSTGKKVDSSGKNILGPEHPLLQHSEHRYEAQYPKKRPEDDTDSGIVLTKPEMAQKKSVFTIAYNDMHTSQLRPDSSVNTP